jgi:transcriptional regulator with XRE-family HTH domain
MSRSKSFNAIDMRVGARVRMRRLMLDMSQEKLGNALGLTFQQVQKYEKGANRIGAGRLQHLSAILQVPIAFFFDGMTPATAVSATGFSSDLPSTSEFDLFLSSSEGLALIKAFIRIKNAEIRRCIVELAVEISNQRAQH